MRAPSQVSPTMAGGRAERAKPASDAAALDNALHKLRVGCNVTGGAIEDVSGDGVRTLWATLGTLGRRVRVTFEVETEGGEDDGDERLAAWRRIAEDAGRLHA